MVPSRPRSYVELNSVQKEFADALAGKGLLVTIPLDAEKTRERILLIVGGQIYDSNTGKYATRLDEKTRKPGTTLINPLQWPQFFYIPKSYDAETHGPTFAATKLQNTVGDEEKLASAFKGTGVGTAQLKDLADGVSATRRDAIFQLLRTGFMPKKALYTVGAGNPESTDTNEDIELGDDAQVEALAKLTEHIRKTRTS